MRPIGVEDVNGVTLIPRLAEKSSLLKSAVTMTVWMTLMLGISITAMLKMDGQAIRGHETAKAGESFVPIGHDFKMTVHVRFRIAGQATVNNFGHTKHYRQFDP